MQKHATYGIARNPIAESAINAYRQMWLASLGAADLDGDVVTSCGSGITACHNALAMRVAGLPDPILYPGSYSDWTAAGEPVATGSEPGSRPK